MNDKVGYYDHVCCFGNYHELENVDLINMFDMIRFLTSFGILEAIHSSPCSPFGPCERKMKTKI